MCSEQHALFSEGATVAVGCLVVPWVKWGQLKGMGALAVEAGVGLCKARGAACMWVADAGAVGYGRVMGVSGRFAGMRAACCYRAIGWSGFAHHARSTVRMGVP